MKIGIECLKAAQGLFTEVPHWGGFFSLMGLRRLGLFAEANCYSLPYILVSLFLNPKFFQDYP